MTLAGLLLAVVWVWGGVGCATIPDRGVRSGYLDTSVQTSTILPFFARGRFSLSRADLDERLRLAEQTAVRWLRARDVRIRAPGPTREVLKHIDVPAPLNADASLDVDLAEAFESAERPQQRRAYGRATRALGRHDKLDRYLLFGELLYQTVAWCGERADAYNERANVVVAPDAKQVLPRPCVVTHFQARLVDSESGETVWFNRTLRELHPDQLDRRSVAENIRACVRETFSGSGGLEPVVGTPDQSQ